MFAKLHCVHVSLSTSTSLQLNLMHQSFQHPLPHFEMLLMLHVCSKCTYMLQCDVEFGQRLVSLQMVLRFDHQRSGYVTHGLGMSISRTLAFCTQGRSTELGQHGDLRIQVRKHNGYSQHVPNVGWTLMIRDNSKRMFLGSLTSCPCFPICFPSIASYAY